MHDRNDPCQDRPELNRPVGYKIPSWCGGSKKTYVYNPANYQVVYVIHVKQ